MAAAEAVAEDMDAEFVEISVKNARTHIENGKAQFTDYEVELKTNHIAFTLKYSRVRRRYSDFIWLRRRLAKDLMTTSPPALPGRRLFGRFKKDFIKQRQNKLQNFLNGVVRDNMFLSHTALHLFLQSKLTVKEIEEYIDSNDEDDTTEAILASLPLAARLRSESECAPLPREWSLSSGDSAIDACQYDPFDGLPFESESNDASDHLHAPLKAPFRKNSSDGNSADDECDGEDDESGVALEEERELDQRLFDLRVSCLNVHTYPEDFESSVEYLQDERVSSTNNPRNSILKNDFTTTHDDHFRPLSRRRRRSKRRKPASSWHCGLSETQVQRGAVSVMDISEKSSTVRRCYSFYKFSDGSTGLAEISGPRVSRTQSLRTRQRHSFGADEGRSSAKRKISLNEYCIVKRDSVLSTCSFEETEFNKSL